MYVIAPRTLHKRFVPEMETAARLILCHLQFPVFDRRFGHNMTSLIFIFRLLRLRLFLEQILRLHQWAFG